MLYAWYATAVSDAMRCDPSPYLHVGRACYACSEYKEYSIQYWTDYTTFAMGMAVCGGSTCSWNRCSWICLLGAGKCAGGESRSWTCPGACLHCIIVKSKVRPYDGIIHTGRSIHLECDWFTKIHCIVSSWSASPSGTTHKNVWWEIFSYHYMVVCDAYALHQYY